MTHKAGAQEALSRYRQWGLASLGSFVLLLTGLIVAISSREVHQLFFFLLLLTGFLWIGLTSISRHAYVLVKRAMGREATVIEFLGTQFGVIFFPLMYFRLKREVYQHTYKRK